MPAGMMRIMSRTEDVSGRQEREVGSALLPTFLAGECIYVSPILQDMGQSALGLQALMGWGQGGN